MTTSINVTIDSSARFRSGSTASEQKESDQRQESWGLFGQIVKGTVMIASLAGAGVAIRWALGWVQTTSPVGHSSLGGDIGKEVVQVENPVAPLHLSQEGNLPVLTTSIRPPVGVELDRMAMVQGVEEAREAVALSVPAPISASTPVAAVALIKIGSCSLGYSASSIILDSSGTLAFVGGGYDGFTIIDISNPLSPLSKKHPQFSGSVRKITLNSNATLAFIAHWNTGGTIFNIKNITNPTELEKFSAHGGFVESITLSSNETLAFVADGTAGLMIMDIKNTSGPIFKSNTPTNSHAYNVILASNETLAFVADGTAGLTVMDVRNTSNPIYKGTGSTKNTSKAVVINPDETLAFIADGAAGLTIMDIRDKISIPILKSNVLTNGDARRLALSSDGSLVFVAVDAAGLTVMDVRDALNSKPIHKGNAFYDYVKDVALSSDGALAFVVGDKGLNVLKIAEISTIPINHLSSAICLTTGGTTAGVALIPNSAFVITASGSAGLKIFDINSPTTLPVNIPTNDSSSIAIRSDGTLMFVADGSSGLKIFDISNPTNPSNNLVTLQTAGVETVTVSTDGAFVFSAAAGAGIRIFDVRNPSVPISYNYKGEIAHATSVILNLNGTLAFVTDYYLGLLIFDVKNVSSPIFKKQTPTNGHPYSVTLNPNETLVFVANKDAGLTIIDIRDLDLPIHISNTPTKGQASDVVLSSDGTVAFIADGTAGLTVINIENPAVPIFKFSSPTSGSANRIALNSNGTLVFVADGSSGFMIMSTCSYFSVPTIFSRDVMNEKAVLKIGMVTNGKLFFFTQKGDSVDPAPPISGVYQINTNTGQREDLPYWMSFSKTNAQFSVTPTKDWNERRLIIETQIVNGNVTDYVWSYLYIEPSLSINTNNARVSLSSPASTAAVTITLDQPTAGKFISEIFGTVSASFKNGKLSAVGTLDDLNDMLQKIRFSLDDPLLANSLVRITVDDTVNVPQSVTVSLSKFTLNNPPRINPAHPLFNQTFKQGQAFSFKLSRNSFNDTDDMLQLQYSAQWLNGTIAEDLPSWVSFDAQRLEFSGKTDKQEGIVVLVTATDGYKSVSESFILSISDKEPFLQNPIQSQSVKVGRPFEFYVPLNTFNDTDDAASTLQYSSPSRPSWLNFDADRRRFYGTPDNTVIPPTHLKNESYVEIFSVQLVVTDGVLSAATQFNITVSDYVPILQNPIQNKTVKVGQLFDFTIPFNTFNDTDDTESGFKYSINNKLPDGIAFDADRRRFYGTPVIPKSFLDTHPKNESYSEIFPVQLVVTDGVLQATTSFNITVSDQAPVLSKAIPNSAFKMGQPFAFDIPPGTFADADDTALLTYFAKQTNGTELPSWLTFNPTQGRFTGTTPYENQVISIEVTASDGYLSTSTSFELRVSNQKPFQNVIIPIQNASIGKLFDFTIPPGTFLDPDKDDPDSALTYSISNKASLPTWLTFDSDRRRFYGTPAIPANIPRNVSYSEMVQVNLTVTDGGKLFGTGSFNISVKGAVPILERNISSRSIKPGKLFAPFSIPSDAFRDPDNFPLTLSPKLINGSNLPTWLEFNPGIRQFSGTAPNIHESLTIVVSAIDSTGLYTDAAFQLVIGNKLPIAPAFLPPFKVKANAPFQYSLNRSLFLDPDGEDVPDISIASVWVSSIQNDTDVMVTKPSWLGFDTSTWLFSSETGAPISAIGYRYNFSLMVSDGTDSTLTNWLLAIRNNTGPVLKNPFSKEMALTNEPYRFQIPDDTFSDANNDTISYSVNAGLLPVWLKFDGQGRTFSGKPTLGNLGEYRIVISATDDLQSSGDTTLVIEVIRSPLDMLVFVASIVGPIVTGLGAAYTAYQKYPAIWNALARSKYHWEEAPQDFLDGKPYTPQHKDGTLINPADIEQVRLFKTTEDDSCGSNCVKRMQPVLPSGLYHNLSHILLPDLDGLPTWLSYDHEANTLRLLRDAIPAFVRGSYVLKVLGSGGKILQQFELNTAKILASSAIVVDSGLGDNDSDFGVASSAPTATASGARKPMGGVLTQMQEMLGRRSGAVGEPLAPLLSNDSIARMLDGEQLGYGRSTPSAIPLQPAAAAQELGIDLDDSHPQGVLSEHNPLL